MPNDENEYAVIVDPAANDRMHEHFEFLAQISEPAALKLLDGLVSDLHSLKYFPYRNPIYNRPYLPNGKYRYMLSCKRYRIVYQIERDTVYVDDIQDCRQSDKNSLLFDE